MLPLKKGIGIDVYKRQVSGRGAAAPSAEKAEKTVSAGKSRNARGVLESREPKDNPGRIKRQQAGNTGFIGPPGCTIDRRY